MNIAFDPKEWSAAIPFPDSGEGGAQPDWHVLRSRLSDALAASRALGERRRESRAPAFGSFSESVVHSLGRMHGPCSLINQASSGNRKRGERMMLQVAGASNTGGRGQR